MGFGIYFNFSMRWKIESSLTWVYSNICRLERILVWYSSLFLSPYLCRFFYLWNWCVIIERIVSVIAFNSELSWLDSCQLDGISILQMGNCYRYHASGLLFSILYWTAWGTFVPLRPRLHVYGSTRILFQKSSPIAFAQGWFHKSSFCRLVYTRPISDQNLFGSCVLLSVCVVVLYMAYVLSSTDANLFRSSVVSTDRIWFTWRKLPSLALYIIVGMTMKYR